MTLLAGKRALILGIANRYSLAYSIATHMKKAGAEIALSYQNENMQRRIKPLAEALDASFCEPCDVSQDNEIIDLFTKLKKHWGRFDILVHAIAYAPQKALQGDYLSNTHREDFRIAHDVSSYSFTALAQHAKWMLRSKGALLTLTYLGSKQVIPGYNVMGIAKASLEASVRYIANDLAPLEIRANAISASPIRTVAASTIESFDALRKSHDQQAPLKTTPGMIADAAVCLCSDWMQGVTGEIIHVDGGFHAVSSVT